MTVLIDRVWRRHRRSAQAWERSEIAATWQICSLLLDYPSQELLRELPTLRAVTHSLPATLGGGLRTFLDSIKGLDMLALQQEYVDTFDVTRKCALHLTYATCGDTRRRGVSLVQFKQTYRAAGVALEDEDAELPDFLPMVLEFGALTHFDSGWRLLTDHRVSIELLHRALLRRESRWLPVMDALRATLPTLVGTDEEALAALIAAGPPTEEVGIDGAMDPYSALSSAPQSLGLSIPVGAPR